MTGRKNLDQLISELNMEVRDWIRSLTPAELRILRARRGPQDKLIDAALTDGRKRMRVSEKRAKK